MSPVKISINAFEAELPSTAVHLDQTRPSGAGRKLRSGIALRAKLAVGALALATMAGGGLGHPATTSIPAQAHPVHQTMVQLVVESTDSSTVIGVADSNLYDLDQNELAARLSKLQSLGVTSLRVGVPWVYIQPTGTVYDWTRMDNLVETASSMGFTITGAITGTPPWAGMLLAGAPNPPAFADFAGAVAGRYGTQISTYEIWNEPNGVIFYAPVSAASYTELLKGAYTSIKAAQPSATVLAGALGATTTLPGITLSPQEFLAQMYDAGAAGHFDALSFHPYHQTLPFSTGTGITNSPLEQIQQLYAIMAANGDSDLRIWATEFGTATTPGWGVTEAEQAALLRDFITGWSRLAYAGPAFVYTTQDIASGVLNHEFNFGLFSSNGAPKLAAAMLAQLIADSTLGALPDYTAAHMSYARHMYLQLATFGFGLANQALVLPHAVISNIYKALPPPVQRAFDVVTAVVTTMAAGAMTAIAPAAQLALGALLDVVPNLENVATALRNVARQGIQFLTATAQQIGIVITDSLQNLGRALQGIVADSGIASAGAAPDDQPAVHSPDETHTVQTRTDDQSSNARLAAVTPATTLDTVDPDPSSAGSGSSTADLSAQDPAVPDPSPERLPDADLAAPSSTDDEGDPSPRSDSGTTDDSTTDAQADDFPSPDERSPEQTSRTDRDADSDVGAESDKDDSAESPAAKRPSPDDTADGHRSDDTAASDTDSGDDDTARGPANVG